ncbi:RagB/SusD family nutrient uptake outer membrane protein [Chitinophaga qingshengii]|uniref:RagB/SusD family nutrient uptake outer membrane protein n=1 Tax=Chitinophaga qingshengii TaxID=1569794 RepID=A0ABR7TSS6_9BACT|nr:RagB/SusD family nutrient uptake outer membrane protein [Chitinophaga qingshengii]MBC9933530.1 RagB/SusD family nutrient uptake outer membrane protein [Chitinophaga qingshengii]
MKYIVDRIWITAMLCFTLAIVPGCKKYLDVTPENVGTIDYAFRNRNEAENYLFTCYGTLQNMSDVVNDPGFTTSGEIVYPNDLSERPISDAGFQLMRGTVQNISNPVLNYWDGDNGGQATFQAIRRCNIMLENIDKPIDLSPQEKARWIAETKFLKAYYHYTLARMYGPIPIYKVNQSITAPISEIRVKRQPVDSVFNYVVQLLDEAIPDLPQQIGNLQLELGRITRITAMTVKAEVLAMQASPLFNGNADYAQFKNKDGQQLFPAAADQSKWQRAADACKAALEEATTLNMRLYTFIQPANLPALNDSLRKVLTIQNAVTEKWDLNAEVIWALNPNFGYQSFCIPRLTSKAVENSTSAAGSFTVPMFTTDLFYTNNGVPINEDLNWDYAHRFDLQTGNDANKYYIKNGYVTVKNNFAREARYYANIGFDGGIWFGNGVTDPNNPLYIEAKGPNSKAGPKDRVRINMLAAWPKKLVNYLTVFNEGVQQTSFRLPRIRLADLYLLYAECLNEVAGPGAEVYRYIDMVRARAGLKGVVESWAQYSKLPSKPASKEGLREIIHRERRIELCFEGRSGWDLRRWKEMLTVLSNPIQGWSIFQNSNSGFYTLQTLFIPAVTVKDYFWPLSDGAMSNNPNLVQTLYW